MEQTPLIISQSRESETDKSAWKLALFAALGAGSSFAAAFYGNRFLTTGDYGIGFSGAAWAVLFLIVALLSVFFVKSRLLLRTFAFLWGIVPVGFLAGRLVPVPSWVLVAGVVVSTFVFVQAARRGGRALENSVKVDFFGVAREALPRMVTALLIFFSVLLYLNYFEWGGFNATIGRALTDQMLTASEPVLTIWFPAASIDKSVKGFFDAVAESELRQARADVIARSLSEFQGAFTDLPPFQQRQLVDALSGQLQKAAEKFLGPLAPDTPMREAVFRGIEAYVQKLPENVRSGAGALLALTVFGTLKGIASLLYWLLEGIAFLVFKFLVAVGFARVAVEMRSREFVILS